MLPHHKSIRFLLCTRTDGLSNSLRAICQFPRFNVPLRPINEGKEVQVIDVYEYTVDLLIRTLLHVDATKLCFLLHRFTVLDDDTHPLKAAFFYIGMDPPGQ